MNNQNRILTIILRQTKDLAIDVATLTLADELMLLRTVPKDDLLLILTSPRCVVEDEIRRVDIYFLCSSKMLNFGCTLGCPSEDQHSLRRDRGNTASAPWD